MIGSTEEVHASLDNRARFEPCGTLLLCLTAALLWVGLRTPRPADPQVPPPPSLSYVNPNSAPWWELTALPQIGEGLARRIIDLRDSGGETVSDGETPLFACPADLAKVRGIGPKTVMRVAPHVWFGGSS